MLTTPENMSVIILLSLLAVPILGFLIFKNLRTNNSLGKTIGEYIALVLFGLSMLLFGLGLAFHGSDYTEAIDVVDSGYTPFASKHASVLYLLFVLAIVSMLAIWLKGRKLPPLLLVLALVFMSIGLPVSAAVLVQVSGNREGYGGEPLFMFLPIFYIIISFLLFGKIAMEDVAEAPHRNFKNKQLQYLNNLMANTKMQPVWVLILLVPVFLIITAILALFGQDTHAITKVFTDTTTWHLSQQSHPPALDHRGHYLCTVAACGNPAVVKPLRLGQRHGRIIIVNRQLQVANAFEQLVQEFSPSLHRIIRRLYDQYGYPLSQKITTPAKSNTVYWLMKPLEYFFVIVLYCACVKPEDKIQKQYA